jgi:hypothetical protein
MRKSSDKKIIQLMRESYEQRVFTTLLEMEVIGSDGEVLIDAGLEVTHVKTNKKFTVQSVQKNGKDITVNLISPENITGPITSNGAQTLVSPGQNAHSYSIEDFEKKFKV